MVKRQCILNINDGNITSSIHSINKTSKNKIINDTATATATATNNKLLANLKYKTSLDQKLGMIGTVITNDILICNDETKQIIYNYLSRLDEMHIQAYEIAIEQLGDSFDIVKSIGYNKFVDNL
jgi:hypothetical protein